MILGTIAIITAISGGYITLLKMCDGDNHVSREENQRRYEVTEKKEKRKKKEKLERDKKFNKYVFDK